MGYEKRIELVCPKKMNRVKRYKVYNLKGKYNFTIHFLSLGLVVKSEKKVKRTLLHSSGVIKKVFTETAK